ncbi:MAG TPA: hypothetical protein VFD70_21895 [Anaerolineae bacterium]|nr:hypothetical protein [Anaerolineae bacterium]
MSENAHERLLAHLAERVRDNPAFMANVLMRYQQLEKMDENALAAYLQTNALGVVRLKLCRRPESGARFAEQVRQIAAYANADVAHVAQVIRYVESIDAFAARPTGQLSDETARRSNPKWSGAVAAARDREESDQENEDDNVAGSDESNRD